MLYGSARYVKKFGGRLNFAKAICPVVLLASEIYSLAFFNLKNQILPRFSLMLLGLYGGFRLCCLGYMDEEECIKTG